MKTNNSLVIAMIVLSIFASNAFALIRSPYPRRPTPPDNIIVISDDLHGSVRVISSTSK
jgi:hypothetical protein